MKYEMGSAIIRYEGTLPLSYTEETQAARITYKGKVESSVQ